MSVATQKAKDEPLLLTGAIITVIVFAAGKLNIVIDHATVAQLLTPIVTAIVGRFFVTPSVS